MGYGYGDFRPEEPAPRRVARVEDDDQPEPSRRNRSRSWIERARIQLNKIIKEPEEDGEENF